MDTGTRNELVELFTNYPQIIAAYFYGSQVAGHAALKSDLDLALMSDGSALFNYGDLYLKISNIIKTKEIDLRIVDKHASPAYLFQVLKRA